MLEAEAPIVKPITGKELSPAEINAEVQSRTDALQLATQAEIQKCINNTQPGSLSHRYFSNFASNHQPVIPREQVEEIRVSKLSIVDSNTICAGINKNEYLKSLGLNIEVEKEGKDIVAWVLKSTRVLVLKDVKTPPNIIQLHEKAASIRDSLEPSDSEVLDYLVGQHLGIPLNHLALYAEIENEALSEAIDRINTALKPLNITIHVRNGIAILGTNQGSITVIDNQETRKNLFPKKKVKETPEATIARLSEELQSAKDALEAEKTRTAAAEAKAQDLQTKLDELRKKLAESEVDFLEMFSYALKEAGGMMKRNDKLLKDLAAAEARAQDLQATLRLVTAPTPAPRPVVTAGQLESPLEVARLTPAPVFPSRPTVTPPIAPVKNPAAAPTETKKLRKSLATIVSENVEIFGGSKDIKFILAETLAKEAVANPNSFLTLSEIIAKAGVKFSDISRSSITSMEFSLGRLHLKLERGIKDTATAYRLVKMKP